MPRYNRSRSRCAEPQYAPAVGHWRPSNRLHGLCTRHRPPDAPTQWRVGASRFCRPRSAYCTHAATEYVIHDTLARVAGAATRTGTIYRAPTRNTKAECQQMSIYIGLDIGGTKLMVAAADGAGSLLRRTRGPTPLDLEQGLDALHQMIVEVAQGEPVAAIGAAIGGPLDAEQGVVSPLHQ